MKKVLFVFAAALAMVACGNKEAKQEEAPACEAPVEVVEEAPAAEEETLAEKIENAGEEAAAVVDASQAAAEAVKEAVEK